MEAFSGFNDDWDLHFSDEEIEAQQTYEAAPQPMTKPVSQPKTQPKTQPQTQPTQQSFDYQNPVPNTTNNNQNFEPFGQETWADPMPANNDPFVTDSWDPNANIDPFGNTESWADQDPYAEVEPEPVQETTYQPQAPKTQQMTQPMVDNFDEEKEEDVPVPTHTEQRKQKETKANTQRNKKPATVIQSSKATAGSGWKNMKGTSMFKQQPQQRKQAQQPPQRKQAQQPPQRKQAAVRKQQTPKGPRKTQSKQQPARPKTTKPSQSKMTQSKPEPKAQAPPRQAQPALTLESLQKQIFDLQARVVELEKRQTTV